MLFDRNNLLQNLSALQYIDGYKLAYRCIQLIKCELIEEYFMKTLYYANGFISIFWIYITRLIDIDAEEKPE